jgi:ADP-ribose pyrophosphatase
MKITNVRKLTDLKWINLFEVQWIDKNGRPREWQVTSRAKKPKCIRGGFETPDAVVIVPFHVAEHKLVIIREYRVALAGVEYGFPAGLIDDDETIEQATCRELKEETGLEVTRVVSSSPPIYSSAGMTDESVSMVHVECDGTPTAAFTEGSESIEVELVSAARAARLCGNPDLKFDAKAWLVLSSFAASGTLNLGRQP